jgi:epoxyqueuosine reductase
MKPPEGQQISAQQAATKQPPDLFQLAASIKQRARELGFDLVGIASAEPSRYRQYFRDWLDTGQAGDMTYLANRFAERTDPAAYLPGARSVICVAINYHVPLAPVPENDRPHHARIARYALGDDYHEHIKARLHQLADWICDQAPDAQTRAAVDTAPVMEKELSARAGVGWLGKNTCIINEEIGSWILLGEIITTLPLPADPPATDRCGSCTRCIDACPTAAITAPYQLDARRCISYLTIEYRAEIPDPLKPQLGDWLFGCDICQDVCPWNKHSPTSNDPPLQPRFPTGAVDLNTVLNWTQETYRTQLANSAIKRVKLPVLQRNASIIQENLKSKI